MKTVVALGGGGIKGLVTAEFLAAIGLPMPDLIVGTSTGGILALAVALGKPLAALPGIYRDRGPEIFRKRILAGLYRAKYSNAGLLSVIEEQFGHAKLGQCLTRAMVVCQWKADNTLSLLKSWRDTDILAVDAALCTSAAPTYFPVHMGRIDGGMARNNPCGVAMAEALRMFPGEPFRLLSINCPRTPSGSSATDGDWGAIRWMTHGLIESFMASGMDASAYETQVAMEALGYPFLHVEPEYAHPLPMDDASPAAIATLEDIASRLVEKHADEARRFLS